MAAPTTQAGRRKQHQEADVEKERSRGSSAGPPPRSDVARDVIGRAVHDLQGPARIAAGFADLLEKSAAGALDASSADYLAEIQRATRRMQAVMEGLLDLLRTGHADVRARPEEFAADDALAEAWANVAPSVAETGASLDHDRLPLVFADRDMVVRVFQNLFSNALKFRHAKRAPCIAVYAAIEGNRVRFVVADNGVGVPKEDQGRIFVPFQRLHGPEVPGTGLGLSICRQLIEAQGGRMWLESRPGKGARFYFELPSRRPLGASRREVDPVPSGAAIPDEVVAEAEAEDEHAPWRVVLTDDVAALRRLVQIYLERDGRFEIVGQAGDGESALTVIEQSKPDLVVLDLSMPKMDGLEVLTALRRRDPTLAVVVLSGFTAGRMAQTATQMGADAYLEKGLEPQVLADRLAEAVEARAGQAG